MNPPRPRCRTAALAAAGVIWLAGVASGLGYMASYTTRAPVPGAAPRTWPAQSLIARGHGGAGLVLFVHPRCPCSTATLSELERILARSPGMCRVTVAFYAPSSEQADWGETALRRRARQIAGATVIDDPDGREAALFGAVNSGHVVVYGPRDDLLFAGGITAARGHEGDNLGEDSVVAALHGAVPMARTTQTFGCEIARPVEAAACPLCAQEPAP